MKMIKENRPPTMIEKLVLCIDHMISIESTEEIVLGTEFKNNDRNLENLIMKLKEIKIQLVQIKGQTSQMSLISINNSIYKNV